MQCSFALCIFLGVSRHNLLRVSYRDFLRARGSVNEGNAPACDDGFVPLDTSGGVMKCEIYLGH